MYRMIALDLDGTTLDSQGNLSPATAQALCAAAEGGIYTVIASGRPYCALPDAVTGLKGFEYAITSNGSSIFNLRTGQRIYGMDLQPSAARSALEIMSASTYRYEIFSEGIGYVAEDFYRDPKAFGLTAFGSEYIRRTRTPIEDSLQFALAHLDAIEGLNLIVPHPDRRRLLIRRLQQIPGIYITASQSNYVELSDASVSKALSLARLAGMLNISPEEIIAFGDAENDLEMLAYAGTGVAMGNAPDEIRTAADAVTLSNDEDGVAYYLNKYIL